MEDGSALGAPTVGGLPDVVPEGTLLNMVLRRMHRPRSCSYQLLLEHQRPSRIQGLRWVSVHPLLGPGSGTRAGGGPGLGEQNMLLVAPLALEGVGDTAGVDRGSGSLAGACGWLMQLHCVCCPRPSIQAWGKRKGICHLSVTSVCLELGACVFSRWEGGMYEIGGGGPHRSNDG